MEEALVKRLVASVECPVCGQHYGEDNIDVLSQQEDLWFLRVVCSACHTQSFVAAVITEGGVAEVINDLTEAELDRFRNMDEVTANELLDMHDFLKDFDGDFSRLFKQKQA